MADEYYVLVEMFKGMVNRVLLFEQREDAEKFYYRWWKDTWDVETDEEIEIIHDNDHDEDLVWERAEVMKGEQVDDS